MTNKNNIQDALKYGMWESLYDHSEVKQKSPQQLEQLNKSESAIPQLDRPADPAGLSPDAKMLGYDITTNPDSQLSERQDRLKFSARQIENTKSELLFHKYIKEIWLGKSLFLAPTPELYTLLGFPSPYKRNVSNVHSFLILLAERLIKVNPLVKYTRTEMPVDNKNPSSTVDLIACLKSGQRIAYEIVHRGISNVTALAARLKDKGFSEVTFIAVDYTTKQRVWAAIKNAGFDPEFLSTIRCTIFSSLIRQKKAFVLKDMS
jgi:hypothetical protein